ncbi:TPA: hypothetical protein DEO28_00510 [Candidatus Dependentiae bacterium]|nr:MAG: hypothetical protein UR14_C0001G0047 [candidate division TM6 bacterium GW2011_GWE2_31_21]KKP54073.1 MAG: hypothetical protein UR43_C0001G0091 [candidate division TM6 bacterium GW2011_GWF2_33_332]HBS48345.1 hypothetical protein [Candidatus Dependentiae bacterium]HBZ72981.1 hypothetical protein [Candidatus Dependentiae bacterium]
MIKKLVLFLFFSLYLGMVSAVTEDDVKNYWRLRRELIDINATKNTDQIKIKALNLITFIAPLLKDPYWRSELKAQMQITLDFAREIYADLMGCSKKQEDPENDDGDWEKI